MEANIRGFVYSYESDSLPDLTTQVYSSQLALWIQAVDSRFHIIQSHIQSTYPTLTARKRAETNSPRYDLIIIYLIYLLFYSQTTCTTTVRRNTKDKSQTTVFTVVWAEVHLFQVPRHHDAHHDAHHVTTSPPHHHDSTTTDHRWPRTTDHHRQFTTPTATTTTTTTKRLATTLTHPTTTKTTIATPVAAGTFFFLLSQVRLGCSMFFQPRTKRAWSKRRPSKKFSFEYIVIDEAHHIKNVDSILSSTSPLWHLSSGHHHHHTRPPHPWRRLRRAVYAQRSGISLVISTTTYPEVPVTLELWCAGPLPQYIPSALTLNPQCQARFW